jgi:hypothetical protein
MVSKLKLLCLASRLLTLSTSAIRQIFWRKKGIDALNRG